MEFNLWGWYDLMYRKYAQIMHDVNQSRGEWYKKFSGHSKNFKRNKRRGL